MLCLQQSSLMLPLQYSLLYYLNQYPNYCQVHYLLEHNKRVVTQRDNRGKTPLICACAEFVDTSIVRALIDANPVAVKIRTRDGLTPLQCACEYNAPLSTIQVLVDAYPEAVKYIRGASGDKYQQAKDYLAYKVTQTEQQAEALTSSSSKQQRNGSGDGDYDHNMYTTQDSDDMRRLLLEEEEQRVEYEDILNRRAQKEKEAALQRLQQEEEDTEQKAAELDRLIHQKESHIRFQPPPSGTSKGHENDIRKGRSFQEDMSFASDRPQKKNPFTEDDDDELLGSNPGNVQKLYTESQVRTADTWNIPTTTAPKGKPKHSRDPSTGSKSVDADRERSRPTSSTVISTPKSAPPKVPSVQQQESPQLAQALKLLEQAEARRQKEMTEAKEFQAKQQTELNKLMERLTEAEEQRQREYADAEERGRKQADREKLQQVARHVLQEPSPVGASFVDQSGYGNNSRAGNAYSVASTNVGQENHQPQQSKPDRQRQDDTRDANGCTPLHLACANNVSYATAQFLMQQFPLAIYQTCHKGNTPLHYACGNSKTSLEVFQLLLDVFPAAVLVMNDQEEAPLHRACVSNAHRFEVIQLLVETSRRLEEDIAQAGEKEGAVDPEQNVETDK